MKSRMLALVGIAAALLALAGSPAQADVTIFDIQLGVYPVGTIVEVNGVVVTAAGRFGFCVQEPNEDPTWGRQWSGIWVYTNSVPTVRKGDLVNIRGEYQEYFGLSELDVTGTDSYVLYAGQHSIPAPVEVLITEVNDTGAFAEAYESVLIRVDRNDNTLYAFPVNQYGEWYLKTEPTGGDSLLMEQISAGEDFEYDVPDPGTELSFAQGILTYNFNQYKLAPRNCETDLGTGCKPVLRGAYCTSSTTMNVQFGVPLDPDSAEDPFNYELASGYFIESAQLDDENPKIVHLTTEELPDGEPDQIIVNNVMSEGGLMGDPNQVFDFRSGITPIYVIQHVANPGVDDVSPLFNEIVTVQGRVTAVEGNYYYIQDGDGGAWRGLYSRVAAAVPVRVGDEVQLSGRVNEYFGATQINFQSGINNFRNFGPAADPVVVNSVATTQIPYRGVALTAEPWEYCLVRLEEAVFQDSIPGVPGPYYGEWLLRQDGVPDTAGVDLSGIVPVSYDVCPGNIVNLTGILRYAFSQYRIAPRTGRGWDIEEIYAVPGCPTTDVPGNAARARILLEQNRPNPFAAETVIRFALPKPGVIRLEVIDVSGRVVRSLHRGGLEAGEHAIAWDGRNDAGNLVGSGTYFYRLHSDGTELSRKMILLD